MGDSEDIVLLFKSCEIDILTNSLTGSQNNNCYFDSSDYDSLLRALPENKDKHYVSKSCESDALSFQNPSFNASIPSNSVRKCFLSYNRSIPNTQLHTLTTQLQKRHQHNHPKPALPRIHPKATWAKDRQPTANQNTISTMKQLLQKQPKTNFKKIYPSTARAGENVSATIKNSVYMSTSSINFNLGPDSSSFMDHGSARAMTEKSHLKTSSTQKQCPKKFKCPCCDKDFTFDIISKRHMCVPTGDRLFKCDFERCGKTFTQNGHLMVHKLVHTVGPPFKCDFEDCGKTFKYNGSLINHKRIHTGIFTCNFEGCGKAFYNKVNLILHKRAHTNECPFKCDFESCRRSFKDIYLLRQHKQIHTGSGPFLCPA